MHTDILVPDVETIEEAIGIPAGEWPGRCYEIVEGMNGSFCVEPIFSR